MKKSVENNLAFIDGQNLHLGTTQNNWKVDFKKFRIYLKDKYKVETAYYFLGFTSETQNDLYKNLQEAGFIIIFKYHSLNLITEKKGNVDTDIVFEVMKNIIDNKDFDKIVLVSGDGDYRKLVDYLMNKNLFIKILFPDRKSASSLYKYLTVRFFDYIDNIKSKIEYLHKKKKGP